MTTAEELVKSFDVELIILELFLTFFFYMQHSSHANILLAYFFPLNSILFHQHPRLTCYISYTIISSAQRRSKTFFLMAFIQPTD